MYDAEAYAETQMGMRKTAEGELREKEAIIDLYRELTSKLIGSVDRLEKTVARKLGVVEPKAKAPVKK